MADLNAAWEKASPRAYERATKWYERHPNV